MKYSVINTENKVVGEAELAEDIFRCEINTILMHKMVVAQLAGRRKGTACTKNRAKVRGGGKKPWRQKGTGRARAGSNRSPVWVGGGTIFGPTPRDHSLKMPKKMKRAALASALSQKVIDEDLILLKEVEFEAPKTKRMAEICRNIGLESKALIVDGENNQNLRISSNNIGSLKVIHPDGLNVYDILYHDKLVILESSLSDIHKRFHR
ncbi:MAG: 50S ribosomal protein L4 [bacterium]